MMFVGLLAGIILIFLLGNIILRVIDREKALNFLENISLSFFVGAGSLTLILFWLSFSGLPHKALFLGAIIVAVFVFVVEKRISLSPFEGISVKMDWKKIVWLALFIIVALKISYSFVETASKPEYSWDAGAHWTYPGKIIYDLDQRGMANIPAVLLKFPGHTCHYPKLIPFMHYWLFSWMGQANDQWSKIFLPIFLLCFSLLFYSTLKKDKSAPEALFFVLLLLSGPLFLYHSTFGYADFTNGLFFSAGIIMFYRWIKENKDVYFYLFSIFVALTTWIKFEGKPLYLIGLVVLAAYLWFDYKKPLRDKAVKIVQYLSAYALIGLPWQFYLFINKIGTFESFEAHYDYFMTLCNSFYGNLFIDGSWGVFWFAALSLLILFYKNLFKRENKYLFLTLLLFHLLFPFIYLSVETYLMSGAAINRQWLDIYPAAVFTLGCISPQFYSFLRATAGKLK